MGTKTIHVFSHIHSITVDKNNEKVLSLTEHLQDIGAVKKDLQQAIKMVQNYKKMGYYPLVEPNFVDDVIAKFSNVSLSRKASVTENCYQEISGYTGCTRVWQLPDEFKVQAQQMLTDYQLDYDEDSWEIHNIKVRPLCK